MRRASTAWVSLVGLCVLASACTAPAPAPDVSDASIDAADVTEASAPVDVVLADRGVCRDMDNDGHASAECGGDDCDDDNPRRNPSAREVCDTAGTDEDCNPCTVAEVTLSGLGGDGDRDEDGYVNQNCFNRLAAGAPAPTCNVAAPGDGGTNVVERVRVGATMVTGTDCGDDPAASGGGRFPGALEVCNSLDDDCDGMRDEGVTQTFYRDVDGDGFGDRNAMGMVDVMMGCSAPAGYALNNTDCNDARSSINPGAREICDFAANIDENCSGVAEEDCGCGAVGETRACCSGQGIETCSMTTMGSVWGLCSARPTSMTETCNDRDDDCNGSVDEGLRIQCYPDGDGDGYPASNAETRAVCPDNARPLRGNCPANFTNIAPTPGAIDCNDSSPSQAPRLPELCDSIDNDCDPDTTDGTTDARVGTSCTGGAGTGRCAAGTNVCTSSGITCQRNTSVLEMCNSIDDDCDGTIDEPTCVHATFNGAGAQVVTGYGSGCAAGNQCSITSCVRGRGNCDGNNVNGCESDFATNPNHCGGCGVRCLEQSACVDGVCTESRAINVNAGLYLTCFVSNAGRVYCMGTNAEGQVGDGTMITRSVPTPVVGITNARQVSTSGGSHACAVRADGSVMCWGANTAGQLGDGTRTRRLAPTLVLGLTDAVEVAAGVSHTCARRTNGTVVCWGDNNTGALGDGTNVQRPTPTPVLALADVAELTAGNGFSCARRTNGEAYCWGVNSSGQLGDGSRINQARPVRVVGASALAEIDAGDAHACARTSTNAVLCWGLNNAGQLGLDPAIPFRLTATATVGVVNALSITAGGAHTCVRRSDGKVLCFGLNGSGQIGNVLAPTWVPREVLSLRAGGEVTAGSNHTCTIQLGGQIACWGNGGFGNLGNGSTGGSTIPVAAIGNAIGASVAAGGNFSCTRRNTGQVLCWGENGRGQLGDGTTLSRATLAPVASITDAADVVAGFDFACARRAGGGVACWGANQAGQLGNGSMLQSATPVAVMGLTDAVQLTAGPMHVCALRAEGSVVCWGSNNRRQLGDGTNTTRSTPVRVSGLAGTIVEVSAGESYTCARRALATDGTAPIYCWGASLNGELGIGTTMELATPSTPVMGSFEWLQVAASVGFTCARRASGQVHCWGLNNLGQLGDGTMTGRLAPAAAVAGLTDSAAVDMGVGFACARRLGGTVACWGTNGLGQLGAAMGPGRPTPSNVGGLSGVTALSSGPEHTCVSRNGSEVLCWGSNRSRQLGPALLEPASTGPVTVADF